MIIRTATIADLETISNMESICFPPSEAASTESFRQRLATFSNHFWLLEIDGGVVVSCINGLVTNVPMLRDEMYDDATMHDENGNWQMIFGVMTLPEYQGMGYAAKLMKYVIDDCKKQGRKGIILTCKNELIKFYEQFGYINEGKSLSNHGGVAWNEMRLSFDEI